MSAKAREVVPQYGIELVDVRIKRLDYLESVREKDCARMISERKRIVARFRSEGDGQNAEILGTMEKELCQIRSTAYRRVREVRGKPDAEATRVNGAAYGEEVESCAFSRTLAAYKKGQNMLPGVPARVVDSYVAGQGHLIAKLLGLFTVAEAQGGGELARGEFMRWFAETPWYPTALLASQGVHWQAVDETSANATIVDGQITLTLLFSFNEAGLIASVRADSRGAGVGKDMVMLPWDCGLSDYQLQDGMLIPMAGEAAWIRPEGRKAYFVGKVKKLNYEFERA